MVTSFRTHIYYFFFVSAEQLESENTDLKCQLGQEEKGKQQECLVATEEKEAKLDDDRNTTRQKYDVENDYHFEFNGHAVQP
jgi:hypothetical protein